MEPLLAKLLEGLSLGQALTLILLVVMLRFVYEIKVSLIKSKAWQESHEQLDEERFANLKAMVEQKGA